MTKASLHLRTILLSIILIIVSGIGIASAQTNEESFAVGPGKQEVVIEPGETVTKIVTISNNANRAKTFTLSLEDLVASDNPQEVVTLLGKETGPYSLSNIVNLSQTEVTIPANASQAVSFTITASDNAEPGGHYGAVIISDTADEADLETGAILVSRIGSLLLIKVDGDITLDSELVDFRIAENKKLFLLDPPKEFEIAVRNNGSVHTIPYGSVKIKNMFGRTVTDIPVDAYFSLPQSTRSRTVDWEDPRFLFGYYSAELNLYRGYEDLVDTKSLSFWSLPLILVVPLLLVLVIFVLLYILVSRKYTVSRRK